MNTGDKEKWNARYTNAKDALPEAAEVLIENLHLLPSTGTALDLACGRGANALLLARQGLTTSAWDISDTAVELLDTLAKQQQLSITTEARDVSDKPPAAESFNVIVVSRFLDRALMPALKTAIKPGGLILYQTFIRDKVSDVGPDKPDYLLDENELLSFFTDWRIRAYREEGTLGDQQSGFRNQAYTIAQKPES